MDLRQSFVDLRQSDVDLRQSVGGSVVTEPFRERCCQPRCQSDGYIDAIWSINMMAFGKPDYGMWRPYKVASSRSRACSSAVQ